MTLFDNKTRCVMHAGMLAYPRATWELTTTRITLGFLNVTRQSSKGVSYHCCMCCGRIGCRCSRPRASSVRRVVLIKDQLLLPRTATFAFRLLELCDYRSHVAATRQCKCSEDRCSASQAEMLDVGGCILQDRLATPRC